jgi:hypothetical protein
MTSFLIFDSLAAGRGEGLRPELRALLGRQAPSQDGLALRGNGVARTGPSLIPTEICTFPEWPVATCNQAIKNGG